MRSGMTSEGEEKIEGIDISESQEEEEEEETNQKEQRFEAHS